MNQLPYKGFRYNLSEEFEDVIVLEIKTKATYTIYSDATIQQFLIECQEDKLTTRQSKAPEENNERVQKNSNFVENMLKFIYPDGKKPVYDYDHPNPLLDDILKFIYKKGKYEH